ncbi:MAG TPA: hypothetical protein VG326_21185 [Tepidisphaeraceae bacterium]|nr:hypothetical protein [Tepidisphaeraceae bacterium]
MSLLAVMEPVIVVLVAPLAFALAIANWNWSSRREKTTIELWARENHVCVLECDRRWLLRGPFFWTTGRTKSVYRITVQCPDGRVQEAWIRLGGWSLKADVRWDLDTPQPPGFPVVFPTPKDAK